MKTIGTILTAAFCLLSGFAHAHPWSVESSWTVDKREITFENDGIQFSGTLHSPSGIEDGPAVVVVHGSGAGERDAALYDQVARTFPAIGFSVLVFDRRGSGASGGQRAGASYRDLARDAVAAKEAIASHAEVAGERIGFWGLSQGGWVAMEAATMTESAFVISASAPLTTPGEQMNTFAYNSILIEGFDESAASKAVAARQVVYDFFRDKVKHDQAVRALEAIEDEPWFAFAQLPPAEQLPADVSGSTWKLEMDYDPRRAFYDVEAPMLFILGGEDPVIPVAETVAILDSGPVPDNVQVITIPDADHALRIRQPVPQSESDDDGDPAPDAATYFLAMGEWLGKIDP